MPLPFDQDRLFEILRAIVTARPGQTDPMELTSRLREELLRLGSRSEDNVGAVGLVEVGPIPVAGSQDAESLGLRLCESRAALSDLLWAVEDAPIPDAVRLNHPDVTTAEWRAATRTVVLLLSALESRPVTRSDQSAWARRPSSTSAWGVDPRHPILPDPHNYDLVGLNLQLAPIGNGEPYVDLTFDGPRRRLTLRFLSPRELSIDEPGPTSLGLEILDVSARGLEGLSVRVDNYEAGPGALRFVARSVEVVGSQERA